MAARDKEHFRLYQPFERWPECPWDFPNLLLNNGIIWAAICMVCCQDRTGTTFLSFGDEQTG
jgi:hypothetical protein